MNEKTFVKKLRNSFANEGFLTRKEVGVGYGVADLVIIRKDKFNIRQCKTRLKLKQFSKLLREEYFKILSNLPEINSGHNYATIDYLIRNTQLSKSFLKYNILRTLERRGYIKKENNFFYFKINGWMPLAKEIIAIEAKMKDWRRGFIQANRYRVFADRVYLAVPNESAHLVDRKLLMKHHVGLIILDTKTNTNKISIPSKKAAPFNNKRRNLAMEFFWGRQLLKELTLI